MCWLYFFAGSETGNVLLTKQPYNMLEALPADHTKTASFLNVSGQE